MQDQRVTEVVDGEVALEAVVAPVWDYGKSASDFPLKRKRRYVSRQRMPSCLIPALDEIPLTTWVRHDTCVQ